MIARIFGFFAAAFAAVSLAQPVQEMPSRALAEGSVPQEFFRASHLPAAAAVKLAAPAEKALTTLDQRGRLRVGSVRPLVGRPAVRDWAAIPEGAVSRLTATSEGADGLRVRLDVGQLAAPIEVRAQGSDGRIEFRRVEPSHGPEAWTPWTPGSTQTIEIFSAGEAPRVTLGALIHFDAPPFAKAAAECTLPTSCTTSNPSLDAAVADRTRSSVHLSFVEGSGAYLCSGTLLNTDRFPAGYVLTANHCIASPAVASTVTATWFYESISCTDKAAALGSVQQAGGAQLVFTNYNPDSTLLLMQQTPPAGAVFSGWNANLVNPGDAVVSISHPRGDTARLATGTMTTEYRITDRSQDEYGVRFERGIIQGGSSGSGLFTLSGGSLQLRGVLTGTTVRNDPQGMNCTNLEEDALYGRFEIFYPQMAPYVRLSGPTPDDTPNRVIDYLSLPAETTPLNGRTVNFDRRVEYVGDVDVFRFTLTVPSTVTLSSQGFLDTIGTLFDGNGDYIDTNDDKDSTSTNFGITRELQPGTYYVMVAPWEVTDLGSYRLVMTAVGLSSSAVNYTDLWWNASESGWGLNLAHQGDILFGTLYTYDPAGNPLWLFMSNGAKQPDGSYSGTIARATGPAFNANPWTPVNGVNVGTMRITFTSPNSATLAYTFNGVSVTKGITRYQFSTPTTCFLTSGDRASATNYQDLWWNPAESGWGVNLAHQGNALFATLYTYDASGNPMWLAMSSGQLIGTRTYQGALHRYNGPPFNASPWAPPVTPLEVGVMRFTFTDGKSGTLVYSYNGVTVTKSITRYEFSNPKPQCSS